MIDYGIIIKGIHDAMQFWRRNVQILAVEKFFLQQLQLLLTMKGVKWTFLLRYSL